LSNSNKYDYVTQTHNSRSCKLFRSLIWNTAKSQVSAAGRARCYQRINDEFLGDLVASSFSICCE